MRLRVAAAEAQAVRPLPAVGAKNYMVNPTGVVGALAVSFANAIISGDFEAAHALLSESLKGAWPPVRLRAKFAAMIDYGDGPADDVELINVDDMAAWESREPADIGWAYVAISGEGFNEAVMVIVAHEGSRDTIRALEWGRP